MARRSETGGEYYIVRIYRRGRKLEREASELVGLVEDAHGERWAFHSLEDLVRLMTATLTSGNSRD